MTWYPSENLIAQLGHFGWGALFIALGALAGHVVCALALLMVWVPVKEFVFDIYVEKDDYLNGALDAVSYGLGAAAAFGFLALVR